MREALKEDKLATERRETWRYSVKLLSAVRYIDILAKFEQY